MVARRELNWILKSLAVAVSAVRNIRRNDSQVPPAMAIAVAVATAVELLQILAVQKRRQVCSPKKLQTLICTFSFNFDFVHIIFVDEI